MTTQFNPEKTALLLCDMQNGFLHPDGAYARGGATSPEFGPVIPLLKTMADTMRRAGGWVVATQFTLVPGRNGEPLIADHLRKLRPFLRKGDFAPGSFDQQVMDDLLPVDMSVEKVAFSAFFMSRLDFVLGKAGIDTLILGGVVTNGGVASTARDAHTRGYHTVVLSDGCATYRAEVHETSMADLRNLTTVMRCDEAMALIRG
ncbi:MAG: cysteine hydrolase [Betaproteobacteria bacterium]|nr:cysteine hydrolase [Betaproteobacteria bacterium]